MNLTALLEAVRRDPLAVTVPAGWGQGRATFGGLMAALQFEAMRLKVGPGRPPRSLAITFVGPAAVDVPIRFEVEILREGKAVSQVLGRALQGDQVMMLMQGSFGASRESQIKVQADPAPEMKAVEDSQELPYIKGVTPEFTRYLALRWAIGGLPFSRTTSAQMGGWVRLRDEPEQVMTEAHLLAVVDAWPPALLSHLGAPAPGSSLTWTIEFVQPLPLISSSQWCKYRTVIEHARDGYGHNAAALWTEAGELVALSRQTVTVFA